MDNWCTPTPQNCTSLAGPNHGLNIKENVNPLYVSHYFKIISLNSCAL